MVNDRLLMTQRNRRSLKFLAALGAAFALVFALAGAVIAGPGGFVTGGPGDTASSLPDGPQAQVSRLSPERRSLTASERAAFQRVFPDLAPGSVPVAHGRTQFDGEVWWVTTWKNKAGASCRGISVPGEGHSRNCEPVSELLRERPIWLSRGARAKGDGWHAVWLDGLVAPSVKSLVTVTTNCKQVPIDFGIDGVFFHLISGADAVAGGWPIRVDAFDGRGAVVSSTPLPVTTPDKGTPFAAQQPSCP